MSGVDNGTLQGGVFAQTKQFGSVLRGAGPPAPGAGLVGDLYLDTQQFFLYEKRAANDVDPWGHYLFQVPVTYQNTLKWFSATIPGNDVGVPGDYCLLWGGYGNYGMQPSIFGPKTNNSLWPEGGDGPTTQFDPAYIGYALPAGVSDEGTPVAYSSSSQLIVAGDADEYIMAIPAAPMANGIVYQIGLQGRPVNVVVTLNPLYAAEDRHGV